VVAVAGRVALLAWHRRRPGNLPGVQPAVARSGECGISHSPVAPPAEPLVGLRLPGEESDPTSAGGLCAALDPGSSRRPALAVKFNIRIHSPVRTVSRPCRSRWNFTSDRTPIAGTQLINDRRA